MPASQVDIGLEQNVSLHLLVPTAGRQAGPTVRLWPGPDHVLLVKAPRRLEIGNDFLCGARYLSRRGNPEERRLLYLAAVSACRNPNWKAIQTALLKKGTIVHCRLLHHRPQDPAHRICGLELGRPYDHHLVGKASA